MSLRRKFIELVKKYDMLNHLKIHATWAYDRCVEVARKLQTLSRWCNEIGEKFISSEALELKKYVETFCPKIKEKLDSYRKELDDVIKELSYIGEFWCKVQVNEDETPMFRDDVTMKEPLPSETVYVVVLKDGDNVVLHRVPRGLTLYFKKMDEFRCREAMRLTKEKFMEAEGED